MSIPLVMPSSYLIIWCPLFFLSSIFPSIKDFSNEFTDSIRWPKCWSFNFSISPSNTKYSGLISLKINWFDLLLSRGISRVFPSTTVQIHQLFGLNVIVLQNILWEMLLYANSLCLCSWSKSSDSEKITISLTSGHDNAFLNTLELSLNP